MAKDDKIYLGRINGWGQIWLDKHSWDCDWYWGFGYLGNRNCHFHIDSLISQDAAASRDREYRYDPDFTDVNHQFAETWLTQDQWWILRDLFIQAYALKKAAKTYRYGGHQTNQAAPYRVTDAAQASLINRDLGALLDRIWALLVEWRTAKNEGKAA